VKFFHSKKEFSELLNTYKPACKVSYSCQVLMTIEFSRKIFEKIIKYQISCQSVQWEPSCSMWIDGQTDKQAGLTKLSSRFSKFGENA
jgi:hypothetical protein